MSRRAGRQNRRMVSNYGPVVTPPNAYGVPVSSLFQWHKGDSGVTLDGSSKAQLIADQTGNGNDWTQSTSGSRPPMTTINSLAAVSFVSGSTYFTGPALTSLSSGAEWFFVTNTTSAAALFACQFGSGASNGFYPYADATYYMEFGITGRNPAGVVISAGVHLIEIVAVAGENTLTVDGVQKYTTISSIVGWAAGGQQVGRAQDNATYSSNVVLAESIVYRGKATSPDRAAIRAGLKAKWGTP